MRIIRHSSFARRLAATLGLTALIFAASATPSSHAAQSTFRSGGITMTTWTGNLTLGHGSQPTGVWTGPPEQVGEAQQISYSNGHTVYYAYFRGLGMARPGDAYTQILASDDWRTLNTSYQKGTDTIELVATNGTRFRRQYTPVYGVVVVTAPSVSDQAPTAGFAGSFGKLSLADGSTMNVVLQNNTWVANYTSANYLGSPQNVSADPDISNGGVAKPRFWGPGPGGAFAPSLYSETINSGTTFSITVPGFSDDMRNGTIFAPPGGVPATPNINITVMQGYTESRTARVGWGGPGSAVTNSNATVQVSAGSGMPTVPPPPPPDQQLMRFAILYVPGDTGELPDAEGQHGGK